VTYEFAVPVTLVRRTVTGRDISGNDVYTETSVSTTGVFAPGRSVEQTDGGETVIYQPTIFGIPEDVDVTAIDAVIVNGDEYEIDGAPQEGLLSPFTGWEPGQILTLKKVTG
jgi:hypothetical protein